ncbi:MAG TPA: hypothetical protein VG848_13455 [Acetobacteraceae bacterium]|nr:hypothetical protein [Acetobacteraceae bacterium]
MDYVILEAAHFGPEEPIVICAEAGSDTDRLATVLRSRGYAACVRTFSNVIFVRMPHAARVLIA